MSTRTSSALLFEAKQHLATIVADRSFLDDPARRFPWFRLPAQCVLVFVLMAGICVGAEKRGGKPKVETPNEFQNLLQANFGRWDLNHDAVLEPKEINGWIQNRNLPLREAAAMVVIEHHLPKKDNQPPRLSQTDLLAVATKKSTAREFAKALVDIQSVKQVIPVSPIFIKVRLGIVTC